MLFFLSSTDPLFDDNFLDLTDSVFLRNTGIGHAIEMATKEFFLGFRSELAVIGNAFVLRTGHEVKEIFFQIRSGAGDGVDLVLPNHFRQGNTQLSRAHRAGKGEHHFPAPLEMSDVGLSGVLENRGVEVPVMAINKLTNTTRFHTSHLQRLDSALSMRNW